MNARDLRSVTLQEPAHLALDVSVLHAVSGHRDSSVTGTQQKHQTVKKSSGSVTDPDPGSIGGRIFEVRQLLRSARKPLPYKDFCALLAARTGVTMSIESIRRYELDERLPDLLQAAAIVHVDPKHRDLGWLAGDLPLTPESGAPGSEEEVLPQSVRRRGSPPRTRKDGRQATPRKRAGGQ